MIKNKQVEFNLNFGGFYESIHDHMIDDSIANYYDKDIKDIYENDKIYSQIDFAAMKKNYCIEWLNGYLKIVDNHNLLGVKFKGINSPEYYNFETDKINASINESIIDSILINSDSDLFEYIDENSQSYDGFTSFYIGYQEVMRNKAVFMTYYTDYLTELNKDKIKYIYEDIFIDIELLEEKND
tara:strand:- start:5839 stop:6390 length:552 start_codon:yes stop_codon:yes gene_type:complete